MKLSERLLQLRGEKEVSQIELAEALNVSRQAVSRWETGQSTPSTEKLQFLAAYYGITIDELFYSVEEKSKSQQDTPPQVAKKKRKRNWVYLCAAALVIMLLVAVLIAAIGHNEDVKEPVSIDGIQGVMIDPNETTEFEFERD